MAQRIDGRAVARKLDQETKAQIDAMVAAGMPRPGLAVILVGNDPASEVYVRRKLKKSTEVGIRSFEHRLPAETTQDELLALIARLNADPEVHGILCQVPLPGHIDTGLVLRAIAPSKDVDGFHPVNVGKLLRGEPCAIPCTPYGVVQMLIRSGYSPEGKHVVICGRSNLVGKPLAALLVQKKKGANATVTICHTGTKDLPRFTKQADILVAAMGVPRVITADMIREGCVVIDVGVNRVPDPASPKGFRLAGDCDFDGMLAKAEAITPVPGGVGPMTVTMLLMNTVEAAERKAK